jgi:repressor LexA
MEQKTIINKLAVFYRSRRRMPSYAELMKLLGLKSKSAAHYVAGKLIATGLLSSDKTGRLAPAAGFFSLAVLGTVEAGFPSPAEEETADLMNLDEYLI